MVAYSAENKNTSTDKRAVFQDCATECCALQFFEPKYELLVLSCRTFFEGDPIMCCDIFYSDGDKTKRNIESELLSVTDRCTCY